MKVMSASIKKYGKTIPVSRISNGPPIPIERKIDRLSIFIELYKNRGKETTAGIKQTQSFKIKETIALQSINIRLKRSAHFRPKNMPVVLPPLSSSPGVSSIVVFMKMAATPKI